MGLLRKRGNDRLQAEKLIEYGKQGQLGAKRFTRPQNAVQRWEQGALMAGTRSVSALYGCVSRPVPSHHVK